MDVLALCASNIATAFMRFYGEKFEYPNHLVDTLKRLPCVGFNPDLVTELMRLVSMEVSRRRNFYRNYEPFGDFTLPSLLKEWTDSDGSWNPYTFLGHELELKVASAFGISESQLEELEFDLREAVQACARHPATDAADQTEEVESEALCDTSPEARQVDFVSYSVGCSFGRWDVRYATGEKTVPELPDPFAPLPVCPPGMLQNAQGLPAAPEDVPASYPIRIPWDGILVDDSNHLLDIERRMREVLQAVVSGQWRVINLNQLTTDHRPPTTDHSHRVETIEHEACDSLRVKSLREYFRKPSGFFADHLKRYSKSRRQAPIYWPLSTASGSYTLWIYYHRLNDDLLYKAVNDYVNQKIADVERRAQQIEAGLATASGSEATKLRTAFEETRQFLKELEDFKAELLRVAGLPYKPNLNDGVLITAAPLWKLFRLPKWRKDLEACWKKLEAGEYDWAHLAYAIWPGRVREVCKRDRSIAIAHGLEDICEVPPPRTGKKTRGRGRRAAAQEEMDLDVVDSVEDADA